MNVMQFMKRGVCISLMALAAWLLSPSVQADDPSTESVPFSQKEEMRQDTIKQDTIKTDLTEEQLQIQRDAQRQGEVSQKESDRLMRVPKGGGPDASDVEITREQDNASSTSF